jgi:hypothetical protein
MASHIAGIGDAASKPVPHRDAAPPKNRGGPGMDLLLIVVLVVLLVGGGGYYGYRSGAYGGRGFGGILAVLVVLLLLYLVFGGGFARGPAVP